MAKSYSELISIPDFYDRLEYLRTNSPVGVATFGGHRYLNQMLYHSYEWRKVREAVIVRDGSCDLAHPDYLITGRVQIHHLNEITADDISERRSCVFDLENLVCVSFDTHNAIHYGKDISRSKELVTRKPNDTCPWR